MVGFMIFLFLTKRLTAAFVVDHGRNHAKKFIAVGNIPLYFCIFENVAVLFVPQLYVDSLQSYKVPDSLVQK